MTTNSRFYSISKIVSGVLNEAPDLTFSSTRRQFTMPEVYGKPAIKSDLDTAAAARMAAAHGGGGSVPSGYSEEARQAAIRKTREQPDRTTIGGRAGTKETEDEGESWIDKAQRVADVATLAGSFIPGLNYPSAAVQAISGAIDVAQGQYGQAILRGSGAAIGLIPGGQLVTKLGTKSAAAVSRGIPGARAVTGLKSYIPVGSPTHWKAGLKAVGGKPVSTELVKMAGGLLSRYPMMGGSDAAPTAERTKEERAETQAQAAPIAPPKPKQKQVEFEGQMWDENLVDQIKKSRAIQASKPAPTQKGKLTPPRKPSGEVDIEAWHLMTGMKIPKSYDETKRAIEVTKPYNYDPLVDPALKSRYEKVRQQIEKNM